MKPYQVSLLSLIPADRALVGVEVGVWQGTLSRVLLKERPKLLLDMVDPWRGAAEGSWAESGSTIPGKPPAEFESAFQSASRVAKIFGPRGIIYRQPSLEFAADAAELREEKRPFDFVFLDGDHSYDNVVQEIRAFLPLIKIGGFLAGHDYGNDRVGAVRDAVRDCLPRHQTHPGGVWSVKVAPRTRAR